MTRAAILFGLGVTLLFACSTNGPVPNSSEPGSSSGSGSSGSSGTSGSLPDGAPLGGGDGSAPALDGGVCNALTPTGAAITPTVIQGKVPAPTGGKIAAGTYDLVEIDVYGIGSEGGNDGGTATAQTVMRTRVFTDTTMQIVERVAPSGGQAVQSSSASSFKIFDVVLSSTETCPYATRVTNETFTASGSDLSIFSGGQREVYKLK
jgi:hypothetical protein